MPFSFNYEVKVDDYTSFGDTRVSDEQGHVSGSYHVQLPDGRHQHVNYKDEGNGYVADVQYNHNPEFSASSVVEYKEKMDSGLVKEHMKSPKKNSSKHSGKCTNKANCYEESSDEKPIKEQIYIKPVSDSPVALFYHQIPSITSPLSYKEPIYFNPASYAAPLIKGDGSKTAAQHVSITTEFSADDVVFTYAPEEYGFWQVMYTTPKYLKPAVSTTEKPSYVTTTTRSAPKSPSSHKTPTSTPAIPYYTTTVSTTTTTKTPTTKAYKAPYPATTSAYKKLVSTTLAYNRPASKNPAVTKKPSNTITPPPHKNPVTYKATTTPVYKTPSTTKTYRIPVSTTPAYRIPVSTTPAYRIPVSTTPAYRIPVSTTPAYRIPVSTIPAYRIPVSTTPAYRIPVSTTPAYRIPVSTTPAYRKPVSGNVAPKKPLNPNPAYKILVSTTPAYKNRYYTTKRNKVASDKAVSKKPFAVYKPASNKIPIKAVDPYVIAPSYNTGKTVYAVPSNVNNIPPYTAILYKPNKQVTQIKY
jgi:hypothetical protein